MTRYRLRTTSGQQYVWEGRLSELRHYSVVDPDLDVILLACPGGTVVNLAHVEAWEPID